MALFGCGDQEDYAEYFCDALGTIRDIIEPRGATIVGHWPTAGYHFEASKGLADDDHFVGLAIDEDRQPELTAERVENGLSKFRLNCTSTTSSTPNLMRRSVISAPHQ